MSLLGICVLAGSMCPCWVCVSLLSLCVLAGYIYYLNTSGHVATANIDTEST